MWVIEKVMDSRHMVFPDNGLKLNSQFNFLIDPISEQQCNEWFFR